MMTVVVEAAVVVVAAAAAFRAVVSVDSDWLTSSFQKLSLIYQPDLSTVCSLLTVETNSSRGDV